MVLPVEDVEGGSKQAGKPRTTESPRRDKQRTQQQTMQCKDNINVEIDGLRSTLSTHRQLSINSPIKYNTILV